LNLEVLELARTPQQEEEGNWAEIGIDKGSNFVLPSTHNRGFIVLSQ